MTYSEDNIQELDKKYLEVLPTFSKLMSELSMLSGTLQNERAREYLAHGVMRRISIITRCIENIFVIYPPDRTNKLTKEERNDVCVNLHSFFINIAGILDNIAWVIAFEVGAYIDQSNRKVHRNDVNLFGKRFKRYVPAKIKAFLKQQTITDWYLKYSKNYRDALAHRIPLYVPPAILNAKEAEEYKRLEESIASLNLASIEGQEKWTEIMGRQRALGTAQPLFTHSVHPDEEGGAVYLHPQILADFETIKSIVEVLTALDIANLEGNEE